MQGLRFLSAPWWVGLVVLFSLCGLSCSSREGHNPVQGKVLYKGKPLSGALVTFHPKDAKDLSATPPVGLTKEDGSFTMTTGKKDGAPAGEYVVTIICSVVPEKSKGSVSTGGMETQDLLGGAYSNRATSKIAVKIDKGTNQLEPFDLK